MNENIEKKYESLKAKLIKLQALADRGYQGEAENAKRLIKRLCEKNGVRIEDILREEEAPRRYRFKIGRKAMLKTLFTHCYAKVTNNGQMRYWQITRDEVEIEVTPLEYVDLKCMFEWHRANLLTDLEELQKNIALAYVSKHRLFSDRSNDEEDAPKPMTVERLRRLQAIFALQNNLNDNKFHKMIE